MEIIEENKIRNETLSRVSPSSQPSDDPHRILKPSLEGSVVTDLGLENNGGGDGATVVVTTTVVEETEISVVKMIQEDDNMKNQEEGEGNKDTDNEVKGGFGNLVDGDEGMKVNHRGNGTSLVEGFFGDEDEQNAIRDPMDICLSAEEEKNDGNASENFESKEDINKIDEENVENGEDDNGRKLAENEEEYDGEEEESEDHNFVVGDFVWGKIKSHPWWPGQIYDPSDASDYAATLKHKGRLLVAYFGDGSFSWCSPSQLKPFIDHFQEMSNQSDSKKFVNAVQSALEEISRLVEAELMCNCQTVNRTRNAGMMNSGIKEGVPVPKGNTVKVLMEKLEPCELVTTLKAAATMDPGARLLELELTVLKSCLSSFYSRNGGYMLAEYHDAKCIEGLEDEPRSGSVSDYDMNGPSESADNGDDKLYQRRKQKSVAELLGEDEPRIKKLKTSKDGGVKRERKRKALVVSVTPESDHESGGGGGGVEEETMSPRQRKKSKYLSPPYLSPIGTGKLSVLGSGSGSGSFKEPKTEPEKVPEMAAKQLEDSLKKSSGKKTQSRQKRRAGEGSDSQEEDKKAIHAAVNVKKVLRGLLIAALDPPSFVEKNLPAIHEFISSFRSSIFEEGSNFQKDDDGMSDLGFIKHKLEAMGEMVQRCEESEMSSDVKACLETEIQAVLEKVGKMREQ